jgi:hypothetical protein
VSKIEQWADAIQEFEGWRPGSRSFRNNNPGNLMWAHQANSLGPDLAGYATFEIYDLGRKALIDLLTRAATGISRMYRADGSLYDFFAIYAPATADHNHPARYAQFVAGKLGVPASAAINTLVQNDSARRVPDLEREQA